MKILILIIGENISWIILSIFILTLIIISYLNSKKQKSVLIETLKRYSLNEKGFITVEEKKCYERNNKSLKHFLWFSKNKASRLILSAGIEFIPSENILNKNFIKSIRFQIKISKKYKEEKIDFMGQNTPLLIREYKLSNIESIPVFEDIEKLINRMEEILKTEKLNKTIANNG